MPTPPTTTMAIAHVGKMIDGPTGGCVVSVGDT